MLDLLSRNPVTFLIYVVSLLIAITIHEFSHAIVADRLGDPTPRVQGRISLNPLVHLDMFGTLFLFMFGFGWGKPVQFDPFNLKDPRRDAALISLAGPFSNFILAIILSVILRFFPPSTLHPLSSILVPIIYLNIILGVFNFLPIHPLDGFKIVGGILSPSKAQEWYQLQRYGMIFLIALILPIGGSSMLSTIILPMVTLLTNLLIPGGITL